MRSTLWWTLAVALGCGPSISTAAAGGESSDGVRDTSSSGASFSGTTSEVSSATAAVGGSNSTTNAEPHCVVEVLAVDQIAPERFGTLVVAEGHSDAVLLGSSGWMLSGSLASPTVERIIEPLGRMLAGRFGPGGSWALAHVFENVVDVLPIDDLDASYETELDGAGAFVVGDMNVDDVDDLLLSVDGRIQVWRGDGKGQFERTQESSSTFPNAFLGYAPATASSVAAALVSTGSAVVGLEAGSRSLEPAYQVETLGVWALRGVQPVGAGGRSLLLSSFGGPLIRPRLNGVALVEETDGAWGGASVRFSGDSFTPPTAVDLDADGRLDVVYVVGDQLRGGCSVGDTFVECLAEPLAGTAESLVALDDGGQGVIVVATEDAGVWAHRLGGC